MEGFLKGYKMDITDDRARAELPPNWVDKMEFVMDDWVKLLARYKGKRPTCNCGDALEKHCRSWGCSAAKITTRYWVAKKVLDELRAETA